MKVVDRAAEIGINLNTLATSAILVVMVGIWNDISDIKKDVAESKTNAAVQKQMNETVQRELMDLRARVSRHESDPYSHARLRLQQNDMNKGGK